MHTCLDPGLFNHWIMEYCVWENIGGLNIGEWAISESIGEIVKLANGLTWFHCKILVNE